MRNRYVLEQTPHLTRFMHTALKDLETAIRTDKTLRAILAEKPGTADDVGAALVLAIARRATQPVTVAPGTRIDPNDPRPRSYRAPAAGLARLTYNEDDSLLYLVERSTPIIGRRTGCRTSPATQVLGYLAANLLTKERKQLFGTEPSQQAHEIANRLRTHKKIAPFQVGMRSTEYMPNGPRATTYELQPADFV